MVDIKRLISGFLILASIVSSLAFIFSGASPWSVSQEPQAQTSDGENYGAEATPPIPANAFTEEVPKNVSDVQIASIYSPIIIQDKTLPPLKPTSNLTEAFAQYVSRALLAANPQGPQQDANGDTSIASPGADDIAATIAKIPEVKNFRVPDWDAEIGAIELSLVDSSSRSDKEKYADSLSALFNKYFLQQGLTSVLYKNPEEEHSDELLRVATAFGNATEETKSAPVPIQFADFHRALLTTLVYEKNMSALGANAADDPIKASIILQAKEKSIVMAASNLQGQFQKSGLQQIISARQETKAGAMALLNGLIGIKTAYAQWPTWDSPSFMDYVTTMAKWLKDEIKGILLQVLKNTIINTMQKQVLDWARSGFHGKPAFITNWKQFLENTAETAAGAVIAKINPALCSGLRPLIQLSVKSPPTIGGIENTQNLACTLNLIRDIKGFYNNFANGGWKAYGTVFQIQNNYFGNVISVHDSLLRQTAKAQTNANSQAQAGGGFKNQVVCPFGSTQIDDAGDCSKGTSGGGTGTEGQSGCMLYTEQSACESNGCTWNGGDINTPPTCSGSGGNSLVQGQTITPGYTTAGIVTSVTDSSGQHLVVNANNIVGLITAVVQSLFTRVLKRGF